MHLISFDASPRQLSKLRNGHKVRIKQGAGFNLVVNPQNYHLVNKAFNRNKGLDIQLSPEELQFNGEMSPEQHDELSDSMEGSGIFKKIPFMEGGSIFKKAKKAAQSKHGKELRKSLKPAGRELLTAGKESAHQKVAEAHMNMADNIENEHLRNALNSSASSAHEAVYNTGRKKGGALFKFLGSKPAKAVRRALKPSARAFKNFAEDEFKNQLSQYSGGYQGGYDDYDAEPYGMHGYGLGTGLGTGLSGYQALKMANLSTADANYKLGKFHNETVHGQLTRPTVRRYWDAPLEPRSRGSGIIQMQGRGVLLDGHLPVALQSQPFGANFHMQFFLPPEYRKFNDGTHIEGRGLYI